RLPVVLLLTLLPRRIDVLRQRSQDDVDRKVLVPPEDPAKLGRALAVVPQVRLVNGAVDLLLPPTTLFLLNRLGHDLLNVDRLKLGHGVDHEGSELSVLRIPVGDFPEDLLQLPGVVDSLVVDVATRG